MPISPAFPITRVDQDAFHAVDRQVRGIAFEIHNEFGKYFDEKIYQRELARRCAKNGLEVAFEFPVNVSYAGFEKTYFVDLLINRSVVVETKTVARLAEPHTGQTLNYLFLCNLQHGVVLNFRSDRVQHRFVSTQLDNMSRQQFQLNVVGWNSCSPECPKLLDAMRSLLTEWGAFLDPALYREGLTYLLGGADRVEQVITLRSNGVDLGTQRVHLLNSEIAFSVTSLTRDAESSLRHQRRFLQHTTLKAIHSINLNHDQISFRTIHR